MGKKSSSKLSNYKTVEAFIQCNFLDGFKYIDLAGEIVNQFVKESKKIPRFNMGIDGMTIYEISDTVEELKITPTSIWIHFREPKNIGNIAEEGKQLIERVTKVIKPTMFTRFGWRTYFIRDNFPASVEPVKTFKPAKDTGSYEFQNVILTKKLQKNNVRLEVAPVLNQNDPRKKALLFDVDISVDIKAKKLDLNILDETRQAFRSDELLDTFEELIDA